LECSFSSAFLLKFHINDELDMPITMDTPKSVPGEATDYLIVENRAIAVEGITTEFSAMGAFKRNSQDTLHIIFPPF